MTLLEKIIRDSRIGFYAYAEDHLNVSYKALKAWIDGENKPTGLYASHLERKLGLPVEELLAEVDYEKTPAA